MFPRWMPWLVFLFLGYIVVTGTQHRTPQVNAQAPVVLPTVSEKTYPALAEISDVERWKRGIDPEYAARMNCALDKPKADGMHAQLALKVIEDVPGNGKAAACGDTITIYLTIWGANGAKAYAGELPLALGSRQLAAGLDSGLVGLKPEGERTLLMPPSVLSRARNSPLDAAVLKALSPGKLAIVSVKRMK